MKIRKTNRLEKKVSRGANYKAFTENCLGYGDTKEKALINLVKILEEHSDKFCQLQRVLLSD